MKVSFLLGTRDQVIAPAMGRVHEDLPAGCHLVFGSSGRAPGEAHPQHEVPARAGNERRHEDADLGGILQRVARERELSDEERHREAHAGEQARADDLRPGHPVRQPRGAPADDEPAHERDTHDLAQHEPGHDAGRDGMGERVQRAAEDEGAVTLGLLDQTYFLLGLGAAGMDGADLHTRLAVKTLVMPGGLGSTLKVLILGKNAGTPALQGCSFSRRLT